MNDYQLKYDRIMWESIHFRSWLVSYVKDAQKVGKYFYNDMTADMAFGLNMIDKIAFNIKILLT